MNHLPAPKKQTQSKPVLSAACPELAVALSEVEGVVEWVEWANFFKGQNELRAYPNNRLVMRPSEKFEAKAAGQKCSEAWFSPRREHFFTDNAGIGLPLGIERVIWIGS